MRKLLCFCLLIILISCQKSNSLPSDDFGINCKQTKFLELNLDSFVISQKQDLSKSEIHNLILLQLKFLHGYFDNYSKLTKLKIIKMNNDRVLNTKVERKQTTKTKGVTQINYSANVDILVCERYKELTELEVILPVDPISAYLSVSKDLWELKKYGSLEMKFNPCSSNLIADYKLYEFYWATWNPFYQNPKTKFICSKFLKDNKFVVSKMVKLTPQRRDHTTLLDKIKMNKDFEISIVFGILQKEVTGKMIDSLELKLKEFLLNPKDYNVKNEDRRYISYVSLVYTIQEIHKFLELDEITMERQSLKFRLNMKGIFGNKKYKFNIYLGPTTTYQSTEGHLSFLEEVVENSDLIFYTGHSELGESFKLSRLSNFRDKIHKSKKNQFYGVLSCSSARYFGVDFIEERQKTSKNTEFLLTGFDDHSFYLIPPIVKYLGTEGDQLRVLLKNYLRDIYDVYLIKN